MAEELRTHTALQWIYTLFPEPTWGSSQPPVTLVRGHPDTSGFCGYLHTHIHTTKNKKNIFFLKKKKGLHFSLDHLTDESSMVWACKVSLIHCTLAVLTLLFSPGCCERRCCGQWAKNHCLSPISMSCDNMPRDGIAMITLCCAFLKCTWTSGLNHYKWGMGVFIS